MLPQERSGLKIFKSNSKSELAISKDYFNTDHLRSGLRTRALRGASVTVVAQICNIGIGTLGTIILARLLTPDDFGLVTMVLAFSLLLQNFGVNGFTEATIQRQKIEHKQMHL